MANRAKPAKQSSKSLRYSGLKRSIPDVMEQSLEHVVIDRMPEVIFQTGQKRSTLYGLMRDGKFPRSVSLGPRSRGWIRAEVQAWIRARISASRRGAK